MKHHLPKFGNARSLKKSILFILFILSISFPAKALLNTYSFNTSTETIDPMSSGTTSLITAGQDDIASAVTNIGFTFVMNSTNYTQFSVNSNGLLKLGSTVVTALAGSASSANSLVANADFPKITAYWDNLRTTTTTGSVRSKLNGSAPNRVLVVDWICTVVTSGAAVKFQVWLYETSNNIQFVYGDCGSNTTNYSVGMAASTTANDMASVTVAATFASSTMSNTTANNSNTSIVALTSPNNSYKFAIAPTCAGSLSPAASATNVAPTTQLNWAAGSGTTKGYDVYFGTSGTPPRVSYSQAGTTYNPGLLNNGTIYFWKVVARNDSAQAASCSTNQFTTAVAPACPLLFTPITLALNVSITPTLSWSGALGTITGYDVYLSTNASSVSTSDISVKVSANQAGASYSPPSPLLTGTTYFWKVVSINNGAYSSGCLVNQFTTVVTPVCASTFTPTASSVDVSTTAQLSWNSVSGTTGYDVYFGTASNPPLVSTNQAGTSYNPGTMNGNTIYYWKVQPRNGGAVAACSTIQFITRPKLSYEVSRLTNVAYTSIALTGTPVNSWRSGTNTDDNLSNSIPVGFNFNYDGGTFSSFLVSTNGFLTFNTGTPSDGGSGAANYSYANSVLSSGTAPLSNLMIAPYYEDIVCQGNTGVQVTGIYYQLTGSVGSRILTVQWTEMETFVTYGPNINFQVKLYEGTNNIEFVYGSMLGFDGTYNLTYSASIGLNATVISSTPVYGEVLNQITVDTRNFGITPSAQHTKIPECNSVIRFVPGVYSAYVPGPSAPVNDDTTGAILLNVNPTVCLDLCGTFYSCLGATGSTGIPTCNIGVSTPDDDVWFKFNAINPNTTIKVAGAGNFDPTVQLLDNTKTVAIQCSNTTGLGLAETMNLTTLTIGQTYYVRVYHKSSGSGTNSSSQFSICISATPIPPSNNECVNAITLPISSTMVNGSSTIAGSASPGIPACSAGGTTPDDDVWYKFTAVKAIEVITVSGNTGFNAVIQLFSGTCGNLTSIACVNLNSSAQTEVLTASGLTINNVYYFRVYHAGIGGGTGNYTLSVASPPPPCMDILLPPDSTIDISNAGIELIWDKVIGADNYIVLLDTINPPVKQLIVTTDSTAETGPLIGGKTYYWKVKPGNGNTYTSNCPVTRFLTEYTPYALNVRVFLQNYYTGSNYMKSSYGPADTMATPITVSLVDIENGTVFSSPAILSRSGWAKPYFPVGALENNYHIVINHMNSLETWGQLFTFNTPDTSYDFTKFDSSSYGSNQVEVEAGVWAMYYGDINQDGLIDTLDLDLIKVGAETFTTGSFVAEDLNIDNVVESTDLSMLENQLQYLLIALYPLGATIIW